jgi:hypothetical protein
MVSLARQKLAIRVLLNSYSSFALLSLGFHLDVEALIKGIGIEPNPKPQL